MDIFFPLELDNLRGWRVLLTIIVVIGSIVYGVIQILLLWYGRKLGQSKHVHEKNLKQKNNQVKLTDFFANLFEERAENKQVDKKRNDIGINRKEVKTQPLMEGKQNNDVMIQEENSSAIDSDAISQQDQSVEKVVPQNHIENIEQKDSQEDDNAIHEEISINREIKGDDNNNMKKTRRKFWKKDIIVKQTEGNNEEKENLEYTDTREQNENSSITETNLIGEEINDEPIVEPVLMTEQVVDEIEQHTKELIQREKLNIELEYLKKKQNRDDYETLLIESLAHDPEHTQVLESLADFYMMDNQQKKALPLYKKIVEQQPENHVFLRKMTQVYLWLKDYETAEVLLDTALTLYPEKPKYAMSLVEVYYMTGRHEKSIEMMKKIVQWRPQNLSYWNVLVDLYHEFGFYEQIIEAYEEMILIDPTSATLKRKLLEARTQLEH